MYAPTVPSTPLLEKGEAELVVATRSLVAWELDGAVSPAKHLLVTAEGAYRQSTSSTSSSNGSSTRFVGQHRQASLGVGAYQVSPETKLYMAVVGGVGLASADVVDGDFLRSLGHFEASYTRYYGQVYLAERGRTVSGGISVRGSWVDYDRLLLDGAPVTGPRATFFLEPSVFVRVGRGPLQGMATVGLSLPNVADRDAAYRSTLSPTSSLISIGLVVRPHLFKTWGAAAQ